MNKNIIGIYRITSPVNKIYIGQSTNIVKRFNEYKRMSCKRQPKIYNSIKKYGYKNHIFEIICECLIEELNDKEIYYINLYKSNKKNGLNLRDGGGSKGKHSEESIKKMCKPRPYKKNCFVSEETREKLSIAGKNRVLSEIHKTRISLAHKGKKHSKEQIEKGTLKTCKSYLIENGIIHKNKGSKRTVESVLKMKEAWVLRKKNMVDPITNRFICCRGEKQGGSKLKEQDVLNIRKMFSDGISQKEIMIKFNMSATTIHSIVRNKTWAWLE